MCDCGICASIVFSLYNKVPSHSSSVTALKINQNYISGGYFRTGTKEEVIIILIINLRSMLGTIAS